MIDKIMLLLSGEIFALLLVVGTFVVGRWINQKTKISLLQPLVISVTLTIIFLNTAGMEYDKFFNNTRILNFMLGPSVVALGYVLYSQLEQVKGNVISILTSVFVGSVVAIVSIVLIAKSMGADLSLQASLAPKSITLPIAIQVSQNSGGIPELTIAFVVSCGILGGMIGPLVMKLLGVKSRIAKGLAIGSASHAIGTARAMEMGAIEGAVSGLAIGLMGVMTSIVLPIIKIFLY